MKNSIWRKLTGLAVGLAVCLIFVFSLSAPALAANQIMLVIDGKPVVTDVAPIIVNGRTMVPVRVISEYLGYTVDWEGNAQRVTISKSGGKTILMWIGKNTATVNGGDTYMDSPPLTSGGRTLVPIRFIAESLGLAVYWDSDTMTVTVNTPGSTGQPSAFMSKPQSGFAGYKGYANGKDASIGDFFWFTEDVKWDGMPTGRAVLTDFGAIAGYWKAYTETLRTELGVPILTEAESMEWFNVEISGAASNAVFTYHTKGFSGFDTLTGDGYDISAQDGENQSGRFEGGRLYAGDEIKNGVEIIINDFYTLDGSQYAVGEINYISGEKQIIALVRP